MVDSLNQRRWDWHSVPDGAGILAIRNTTTGKSYFVGVADMRQRAYDHWRLLTSGTHHCHELQQDWVSNPSQFEFVVVESVGYEPLLRVYKQIWIERHMSCTYNRKNSIPRP